MNVKRLFVLVCLLMSTGACVHLPVDTGCQMTTRLKLPVFDPQQFGSDFYRVQKVRIISSQGTFEFLSQIELSQDKLTVAAVTPIGQKLFQIVYQDREMVFEAFSLPVEFNPMFLLSDIGLIYVSPDNIRQCLHDGTSGLRIQALSTARRQFIDGQGNEIDIAYSPGPDTGHETIHYRNTIAGYSITINTLESDRSN